MAVLVLAVGAAGGPEHPARQFAAVVAGEAAVLEVREHPREPVVRAAVLEPVRAPAVADLVVVPHHVGGKAVEHPPDALEAPVAAVDVPVPAQHGLLVREQCPDSRRMDPFSFFQMSRVGTPSV